LFTKKYIRCHINYVTTQDEPLGNICEHLSVVRRKEICGLVRTQQLIA
jgi:hypothetical protein